MYFPTTKSLRDYLLDLLKNHLGTMTLPGGSVVPAIFVGEPPVGGKMQGLELSIPRIFNGNTDPLTGGIAPTNKFEFRLVQHQGSDNLGAATKIIERSLTPITYIYIPAARDPSVKSTTGQQLTLDQCVFTFSRSAFVLR